MPPGFTFPDNTVDLWVPIPLRPEAPSYRSRSENIRLIGRLGTTERLALVSSVLTTRFRSRFDRPAVAGQSPIMPKRWVDAQIGGYRRNLWLLFGAVGLVLLVAAVNVSTLTLARAEERRGDTAVRAALGARGWQVAAPLLAEGVLLGVGGALGGLMIALWSTKLILLAPPPGLEDVSRIDPADPRVAAWCVTVALGAGLAASAVAVLRSLRVPPSPGSAVAPASRVIAAGRLGRALVVGELTLVVPLITVATLLGKSVWLLRQRDRASIRHAWSRSGSMFAVRRWPR